MSFQNEEAQPHSETLDYDMFGRALVAFLMLPGMVPGVVPALIFRFDPRRDYLAKAQAAVRR